MTTLKYFNPPAYLTDLTKENADKWSKDYISRWMNQSASTPEVTQFYNATVRPTEGEINVKVITWTAFPNTVKHNTPEKERWKVADSSRDYQDEYCEWSVLRNDKNEITKVVFTCEGPEYWDALATHQPDTLLQLYKDNNPEYADQIKKEDLYSSKSNRYNRLNKWNNSTTTGSIMHLVQRANTLEAEIQLGADATVLRVDSSGAPIHDYDRLIRCSQYGGIYRNSDPTIGGNVNDLAWQGPLLTIADPVGLYIDSFDGSQFEAPDEEDVQKFWTFTRGTAADPNRGRPAHWVRAVFEVPKSYGYNVSAIKDANGNKILWGSQLADAIQIRLTGQAAEIGKHLGEKRRCKAPQAQAAAAVATKAAAYAADEEDEADDTPAYLKGTRAHGLDIAAQGYACY
ncbi:hypothetical protein L873DRAFT_1714422 [Choiromyces venosus 120613-1]|uniref:Uncharacterized protein n=1 Tax=Choiromyces venosus 120613-1 TaxID=1336337 RepID=A0A3N4IZ10_9PEZI|nr:hypothetical protein L873DRAFT_1714422 [Choiromyces venosus 120613-1]